MFSSSSSDLFLHRQSCESLLQRIECLRIQSKEVLLIGLEMHQLVDAYMMQGVCPQYFDGEDVSEAVRQMRGSGQSFDLICCNLNMHLLPNLVSGLLEIRSLLHPNGCFFGSFFGQQTLWELRKSFLMIEQKFFHGVIAHTDVFYNVAEGARSLQAAGFASTVAEGELVQALYSSPKSLLQDLQTMRTHTSGKYVYKGLYPPHLMQKMMQYYQEHFSQDQHINATFELGYLTAWV